MTSLRAPFRPALHALPRVTRVLVATALLVPAWLLANAPTPAAAGSIHLSGEAGAAPRAGSIVRVLVPAPAGVASPSAAILEGAGGVRIEALATAPGLAAREASRGSAGADSLDGRLELVFAVPEGLPAGAATLALAGWRSADETPAPDAPRLLWAEDADPVEGTEFTELRRIDPKIGVRKVARYMRTPFDASTPARRELTYKPFHHLFDPASGSTLLTKGGPGGLYPHHRGLYFGFNKISYGGGRTADVWHCKGKAHQVDVGSDGAWASRDTARHRRTIHWCGQDGEPFAKETRELTFLAMSGSTVVEFASLVETLGGEIRLDGDPQHAGFHFRANNEVAERTKGETVYVRPDGAGGPGQTRNWPDDPKHADLPWNGMRFTVAGRRYTALYIDRPGNPKEARYSERDYGRFGSYFEFTITPERPLFVHYRFRLHEGELDVESAAALASDFVAPVSASYVE